MVCAPREGGFNARGLHSSVKGFMLAAQPPLRRSLDMAEGRDSTQPEAPTFKG
jgi:hypothetical protein